MRNLFAFWLNSVNTAKANYFCRCFSLKYWKICKLYKYFWYDGDSNHNYSIAVIYIKQFRFNSFFLQYCHNKKNPLNFFYKKNIWPFVYDNPKFLLILGRHFIFLTFRTAFYFFILISEKSMRNAYFVLFIC